MTDIILVNQWNRSIGVGDHFFGGLSTLTKAMIVGLNNIATFALVMKICPKSIEATLFSWVMGVSYFAAAIQSVFGSVLTEAMGITNTDYFALDNLLWVRCVLAFVVVPLAVIVPLDDAIAKATARMGRAFDQPKETSDHG